MLIAAVMPIILVYRLPQGQYGCSGHIDRLEHKLQRQQKVLDNKDNQIRKLDFKAMKDNYDKICSENRQLNALFTRQQKDKEKRRARDEALKEAREWRKRNIRL